MKVQKVPATKLRRSDPGYAERVERGLYSVGLHHKVEKPLQLREKEPRYVVLDFPGGSLRLSMADAIQLGIVKKPKEPKTGTQD